MKTFNIRDLDRSPAKVQAVADNDGSARIPVMWLHQLETANAFEQLVFLAKHGFRAYDVAHVASALILECDEFLSFDAKANQLAEPEGLKMR